MIKSNLMNILGSDVDLNERYETVLNEQMNIRSEIPSDIINMVVIYSALTEYTKYTCNLEQEINLQDTFIYQVSISTSSTILI